MRTLVQLVRVGVERRGVGFAMQEAVVALDMIVQRFRFRLVAGAAVEPVAWITLRPSNGLPMRLERRG